ncbi:adenosylcobinamide-GDP ribazoletransferase [Viridibacillus arvi]|uniref:adenosylcobinamide-GDP ribazoletransferase n=1 Tax=Viridibacillus arvi TaxID=263475 RepID=UPI00187B1A00|nr:adenosylcobinamide-GDP ribazoletransferase [Viridibacillus sp. JNUCC-6]QOV10346.1 adenosylcobinamide-GDP ribazoletransferase [Viridibacillus sp. JNUCC-6]
MRTIVHSILLSFQFFTVVPVHKELPLTKPTITGMFSFLPWLGACMGVVMASVFYSLQHWADISPLLTAFLLVIGFIICTGGLHLDGWVDMGDAFFSYRDTEKRLEILDDPRIGAFGAMSLLFLVLTKIFFLAELIEKGELSIMWIVAVPFLARLGMSLYFIQTKCSKQKGLAYFFKEKLYVPQFLVMTCVSMLIGLFFIIWWSGDFILPLILLVVVVVASGLYKIWTVRNFRGSSGDLLGAFIEGMEAILWITLLLLS